MVTVWCAMDCLEGLEKWWHVCEIEKTNKNLNQNCC